MTPAQLAIGNRQGKLVRPVAEPALKDFRGNVVQRADAAEMAPHLLDADQVGVAQVPDGLEGPDLLGSGLGAVTSEKFESNLPAARVGRLPHFSPGPAP